MLCGYEILHGNRLRKRTDETCVQCVWKNFKLQFCYKRNNNNIGLPAFSDFVIPLFVYNWN